MGARRLASANSCSASPRFATSSVLTSTVHPAAASFCTTFTCSPVRRPLRPTCRLVSKPKSNSVIRHGRYSASQGVAVRTETVRWNYSIHFGNANLKKRSSSGPVRACMWDVECVKAATRLEPAEKLVRRTAWTTARSGVRRAGSATLRAPAQSLPGRPSAHTCGRRAQQRSASRASFHWALLWTPAAQTSCYL